MKSTTDKTFFAKYFGEEHAHTTKELAARFSSAGRFSGEFNIGPDTDGSFVVPVGPEIKAFTVVAGTYTKRLSLVDFLSAAYVGVRGGYNYSLWPSRPSEPRTATVSLVETNGYTIGGNSTGPLSTIPGWTAYSNHNIVVNPSVEVTIPFYYPGMFYSTYETWRANTIQGLSYLVAYNLLVVADPASVVIMKAGADDFTLVGFRGLPTTVFT